MVAEGIAAALARRPCIVPLAFVTSAEEAERVGARADAVAVDGHLRGAAQAAARLRAKGVRVVLIADPDGEDEGVRVPRRASVSVLAEALVPGLMTTPDRSPALTRREGEILALVARGLAAKQVARHLGISAKTVEQHKSNIFSKLGVANQTAAVSLVLGNGYAKRQQWIPSST
jgi:DNA-binding CsgD family transcriptional regulator